MGKNFSIQPRTDERGCYLLCVIHNWTDWLQIRESVAQVKRAVDSGVTTHYVVYVFKGDVEVPKPWSLPLIAQFMQTLQATGHTSVLVNAPRQLRVFVRMAQQVYESCEAQPRVVFADGLAEVPYVASMEAAASAR